MKSSRVMGFAVACGVVIFAVSLGVAYVLFGILESSASADLREWKLGGAFAGFAFSALLLSSTTFQVYRELRKDKEEDYLRQIQDLQSKLVRGAPRPPGYTVDVDEVHRIVFARPLDWQLPSSGTIHQYVSPAASGEFAANFNVQFETAEQLVDAYGTAATKALETGGLSDVELEGLYGATIDGLLTVLPGYIPGYQREALSHEYVRIDGLKSVRYTHSYSRDGQRPGERLRLTQVGVGIFQPRLLRMFTFTFTDDSDSFLESSEQFNLIVSSIKFLDTVH